jgi:hypothetical protein
VPTAGQCVKPASSTKAGSSSKYAWTARVFTVIGQAARGVTCRT